MVDNGGVMAHGRTTQPAAPARGRRLRAPLRVCELSGLRQRPRLPELSRLLELSPATLTLAVVVLAVSDWGSRLAGDSLFPGGPLDEIAHLLTTLLVFWALGARVRGRFLVPALMISVAIDLDHLPGRLGAGWLTAGTPRPYTHSLLTIAVLLAAAALGPRRRDGLLGVVIGLVIHFARDMAEGASGVSLLWPVSYRPFQYSHGVYVAIMAAFVLIDTMVCVRRKNASNSSSGWRARAPQSEPS